MFAVEPVVSDYALDALRFTNLKKSINTVRPENIISHYIPPPQNRNNGRPSAGQHPSENQNSRMGSLRSETFAPIQEYALSDFQPAHMDSRRSETFAPIQGYAPSEYQPVHTNSRQSESRTLAPISNGSMTCQNCGSKTMTPDYADQEELVATSNMGRQSTATFRQYRGGIDNYVGDSVYAGTELNSYHNPIRKEDAVSRFTNRNFMGKIVSGGRSEAVKQPGYWSNADVISCYVDPSLGENAPLTDVKKEYVKSPYVATDESEYEDDELRASVDHFIMNKDLPNAPVQKVETCEAVSAQAGAAAVYYVPEAHYSKTLIIAGPQSSAVMRSRKPTRHLRRRRAESEM